MTLQQVENFADDMQKAGLVMSPSCIKERSCEYPEVLALTYYCSEDCKVAILFPFKITVAMDTYCNDICCTSMRTAIFAYMKLAAQNLPVSLYLPRNEYFLYALLLGYASARPRQSERAEQAFRKAYAKGIEANKNAAQQQEVGDMHPLSLQFDVSMLIQSLLDSLIVDSSFLPRP